jgi:arylsulfatase A-like enzyme
MKKANHVPVIHFPVLLLHLAALLLVAAVGRAEGPPNILLLVSDDQRPDTIAALGNKHIRTPNLDDLTRRGLVFSRATCAHPLCYPSRAELLTGCTGWRNGSYAGLKLNADVPLLPKLLRDVGYHTWYVGKWHTAGRPSGIGFQHVDGLYAGGGRAEGSAYVDFRGRPATGYRGWVFQTDDRKLFPEKGVGLTPDISTEFTDAAIRFIERKPKQPFFLYVNFTAPHDPRLWPTGNHRVDAGGNRRDHAPLPPLPSNFRAEHPFDHGNARGRDELLLPFPRTEDDVRQELACYYAAIEHMDEQIGRILQSLDETGQGENTIVVFTSDHGLAIGGHGLIGKQNMYEHTINVPLVIAGPGIPAGKQSAAQCYLRDLLPTFCDLAGTKLPENIDGKSLVPVLRDPAAETHPFIVGYFQDSQRMIRKGDWKLIWYPKIDRRQLFNVARDPLELDDLMEKSENRERIAEMQAELVAWLAEHGDALVAPAKFK